ncbi:ribonuclease P protein component [Subdoligranulum variabile DSM 15176]|uniref:Ribonuclease P protein component n=2 Tax=Subdoligranulum variabile TaxID=214851 RepID=D1PRN7_9FIRM|nr:ribonuclease P protein component [Subdoligranulum variabile DSM 15176]
METVFHFTFAFCGVLPMRYRTLNKNWQYNRVYGRGKSYVHPHVVLYVAKNRLGYTRIGLTATKKVGHAVQRNRCRRVMRAALSEHLSQNIGGYDIILVARGQTPHLKSTQLSKTLGKLFAKAGLPDLARPVPPAAPAPVENPQ